MRATAALVVVLAFGAALAGCQKPSLQLQHYRELGGPAQLVYARGLPLEERLDLYQSLYNERKHPRDSSLSFAFQDSGDAGFNAALARMATRSDFYTYVWILKAVDASGEVDLCEPHYLNQIHGRAETIGLSRSDLNHVSFRRCALVVGPAG